MNIFPKRPIAGQVQICRNGLNLELDTLTTADVSGLGTMSVQNANAVAITGGTINATTVGATTRATVRGTTGDFNSTVTATGGLIIANETMDTYDEGTWTPTLAGDGTAGSNTYTVQTGRYVKIGKFVIANFCLTMSVKDAAMAGNITLAGLPFAAANVGNNSGTGQVSLVENVAFSGFLGLNVAVNSTFAYLAKNTTAAAIALVQPADLTVTVQIRGTCTYISA